MGTKMKRTLRIAFLILLNASVIIFHKHLFYALIALKFSWVLAYLFPWISLLTTSVLFALAFRKVLIGSMRLWLPWVSTLLMLSLLFALNPVYEGDLNKSGNPMDIQNSRVLQEILSKDAEFEGLVCFASATCPYCIEAVRDKMLLLHQRNQVKVLVCLAENNPLSLGQFRIATGAKDLPILLNSGSDFAKELGESVIPFFVYVKAGKIVHLWRNEQLGYPALDWIEKGLN